MTAYHRALHRPLKLDTKTNKTTTTSESKEVSFAWADITDAHIIYVHGNPSPVHATPGVSTVKRWRCSPPTILFNTLKMSRSYNAGKFPKDLLNTLHNTFREEAWLVKTTVILSNGSIHTFTDTGFSLPSKGLMMTGAEGRSSSVKCIHAIRLVDPGHVFYEVTIESIKRVWDIAVLKISDIEGCKDWKGATLASNGVVAPGQPLCMLQNLEDIPGSVGALVVGKSVYQCIDDLTISSDLRTCSMWKKAHVTGNLEYRILGDFLNVPYILRAGDQASKLRTHLEARIPVIQCEGFNGGRGCGGSPVFNLKGEVVGMYSMSLRNFDIAIHISMLKKIHESNCAESLERKSKRTKR